MHLSHVRHRAERNRVHRGWGVSELLEFNRHRFLGHIEEHRILCFPGVRRPGERAQAKQGDRDGLGGFLRVQKSAGVRGPVLASERSGLCVLLRAG